MSGYLDYYDCPYCGGTESYHVDVNKKSGERFSWCYLCGLVSNRTLVKDNNGNPVVGSDGEYEYSDFEIDEPIGVVKFGRFEVFLASKDQIDETLVRIENANTEYDEALELVDLTDPDEVENVSDSFNVTFNRYVPGKGYETFEGYYDVMSVLRKIKE